MFVIGSSFWLLNEVLEKELELLAEEPPPHPETLLRAIISGIAKAVAPPPRHANTLSPSGVKVYPPFAVSVLQGSVIIRHHKHHFSNVC